MNIRYGRATPYLIVWVSFRLSRWIRGVVSFIDECPSEDFFSYFIFLPSEVCPVSFLCVFFATSFSFPAMAEGIPIDITSGVGPGDVEKGSCVDD